MSILRGSDLPEVTQLMKGRTQIQSRGGGHLTYRSLEHRFIELIVLGFFYAPQRSSPCYRYSIGNVL